jgi:hypothetical protein
VSHLQRYFAWVAAYMAAVFCLFVFTDLHLNWWQTGLFICTVMFWGEVQRNLVLHQLRRKP